MNITDTVIKFFTVNNNLMVPPNHFSLLKYDVLESKVGILPVQFQ